MKKALRQTQTLRALAVVRLGHRPPGSPVTNTHTQTGPITILCAANSSAQYNERERERERERDGVV